MNHELPIMALEPGIMFRPWGGEKLGKLFNVSLAGKEPVGETWNISIHPDAPALCEGRPLSQWITEQQMPYLVKLIDTSTNLSVQVHPDDHFANKFENSQGKSECWLILAAGSEGGIHLGLRPEVSQESFEHSLKKGEDISVHLNFRKVARGDFFYVPAGTLHSIGKDVFLVEVQQNSGITYRVWDWGRRDRQGHGRELHIDKALQVANFDKESNSESHYKIKKNLFQSRGIIHLLRHPQFYLTLYNLDKEEPFLLKPNTGTRISSLLIIEGNGTLRNSHKKIDVRPYRSYILKEEVIVESESSLSFIFVC